MRLGCAWVPAGFPRQRDGRRLTSCERQAPLRLVLSSNSSTTLLHFAAAVLGAKRFDSPLNSRPGVIQTALKSEDVGGVVSRTVVGTLAHHSPLRWVARITGC